MLNRIQENSKIQRAIIVAAAFDTERLIFCAHKKTFSTSRGHQKSIGFSYDSIAKYLTEPN